MEDKIDDLVGGRSREKGKIYQTDADVEGEGHAGSGPPENTGGMGQQGGFDQARGNMRGSAGGGTGRNIGGASGGHAGNRQGGPAAGGPNEEMEERPGSEATGAGQNLDDEPS